MLCSYVFDIPSGKKVQEYTAHEADVIGLSIQPTDSNVFVTASMDKTCKLFDLRSNDLCRQTFEGHDADVNDVSVSDLIFFRATSYRPSYGFAETPLIAYDVRSGGGARFILGSRQ